MCAFLVFLGFISLVYEPNRLSRFDMLKEKGVFCSQLRECMTVVSHAR